MSGATWESKSITGERVELHPGCDLWMRGARFGTVVGEQWGTPKIYKVRVDHVRKLQSFTSDRIRPQGGEYGSGK